MNFQLLKSEIRNQKLLTCVECYWLRLLRVDRFDALLLFWREAFAAELSFQDFEGVLRNRQVGNHERTIGLNGDGGWSQIATFNGHLEAAAIHSGRGRT